jgi:hypothetical protein
VAVAGKVRGVSAENRCTWGQELQNKKKRAEFYQQDGEDPDHPPHLSEHWKPEIIL